MLKEKNDVATLDTTEPDTKHVSARDQQTSDTKKVSAREQQKLDWYKKFQEIAASHGGEVISDKYERMHSKMTFKCKEGHIFSAKCHDVKQNGSWCPVCAGNKKFTVKDLQKVAHEKGGIFLSKEYLGLSVDHTWMCAEGHQFNHTPLNVIHNNGWCPVCTKEDRKHRDKLRKYEEIKNIVEEQGGTLESTEYVSSRIQMLITCKEGHHFAMTPEKLRKGEFCPTCKSIESAIERYTDLEQLIEDEK